jgi:endonuclease/exonuclease/phosphatase (EEP) superfamily protein YafD
VNAKRLGRAFLPVLLGFFLLAGALVLPPMVETLPALAQSGEPDPGTVVGVGTYTAFPTQQISNTGSVATTYSSAPHLYKGLDVSYSRNWNAADAFVTIAGYDTGDAITVTAQWSPDQTNWVDAYYTFIGDTSSSTSTMRPQTQIYRTVPTTDGTTIMRLPIAGMYLRYKLEYSGTLTATIQTTYRNNGGS